MSGFLQRLRNCPILIDADAIAADKLACTLVAQAAAYYPLIPAIGPGCPPPPEPVGAGFVYLELADFRDDLSDPERTDLRIYLDERATFHHAAWRIAADHCGKPAPAPEPAVVSPDEHFRSITVPSTGQILELKPEQAALQRDFARNTSCLLKSYAVPHFPGTFQHIVIPRSAANVTLFEATGEPVEIPTDNTDCGWFDRSVAAGRVVLMELTSSDVPGHTGEPGRLTPGGTLFRRYLSTSDPFVVAGLGGEGWAVMGGDPKVIAVARRGAVGKLKKPPGAGGVGFGAMLLGAIGAIALARKRAA